MKNQFFADRNDFCKYDLLLEILENDPALEQLTFIPMLTEDDGSRTGTMTNYPLGSRRPELFRFLQGCLLQGRRDVSELKAFFRSRPFRYLPYMESSIFRHKHRDEYFRSIEDSALRKALVFVDPDNGLEVPSMKEASGDRYVRYREIDTLLGRMGGSSILMVYQHLPREPRTTYFHKQSQMLRDHLRFERPLWISDNKIAFLLLAPSATRRDHVQKIVRNYASGLKLLFVDGLRNDCSVSM